MTLIEFIVLLIIAGICGSLAQRIAGGSPTGCLGSILLGFIGALLGTWLARQAGLPDILSIQLGGKNFPIVWSVIGAALFSALLAFLSGRNRKIG